MSNERLSGKNAKIRLIPLEERLDTAFGNVPPSLKEIRHNVRELTAKEPDPADLPSRYRTRVTRREHYSRR